MLYFRPCIAFLPQETRLDLMSCASKSQGRNLQDLKECEWINPTAKLSDPVLSPYLTESNTPWGISAAISSDKNVYWIYVRLEKQHMVLGLLGIKKTWQKF